MDNVIIRRFRPEDLPRLGELGRLMAGASDPIAQSALSYTAEHDGEPVLSAGLLVLWHGVAEAWAVFGDFARKHPVWSHRLVKRFLRKAMQNYPIHRVQMHVVPGDTTGERWAEALGFTREGLAHRYTEKGEDMATYSIWRKH